ncbi:MAG: hypothetical protein M3Q15_03470 [Pseudomonadota bacterium]|nr:hypothetical protein [Pseudomonadota bacterium]
MTQAGLWWTAGVAAVVAAVAAVADWRRGKRRDLDRPGWMPWTAIQLLGMLAAVVAAAVAILV